jgi:hypothetical protein
MIRKLVILVALGFFFLALLAAGPFLNRAAMVIFFAALLIAAAFFSWNLLPTTVRTKGMNRRRRFRTAVFASLLVLSLGGLAINFYLLPGMFHPLSLVADLGLLLFNIFLFQTLLNPVKVRRPATGIVLFALFIGVLSLLSPAGPDGREARAGRNLLALPYLATARSTVEPAGDGVTVYNPSRFCGGYNLYIPWIRPEAYLIDMTGEEVHRWEFDLAPGEIVYHVELGDNGDLFAVTRSGKLLRLDRNSNLIWERHLNAHHDLDRNANGDLLVLTLEHEIIFYQGRPLPIQNNYIQVVSEEGELKDRFSLFNILQEHLPPETTGKVFGWWKRMYNSPRIALRTVSNTLLKLVGGYRFAYCDFFHANTIRIVRRDIGVGPNKGDWLICSRSLDMIAIIDPAGLTAKWSWGPGILDKPHTPVLLENGNLLVFDNGATRGYSRVIEIDLRSGQIVWEYIADPPEAFFTEWRGSCQKLPNGNVLITESGRGRVFEITPAGETAWEFFCPFWDEENKERSVIYRMKRILDRSSLTFLSGKPKEGPPVE